MPERSGDIERREIQREATRGGLEPGNVIRRRVLADHQQPVQQIRRTARAIGQTLPFGSGRVEHRGEIGQPRFHPRQRRMHGFGIFQLAPGITARFNAECQAKIGGGLLQCVRGGRQLAYTAVFLDVLGDRIAAQT